MAEETPDWFLERLAKIDEIDISSLARSAFSSRHHHERLSRKGLANQAQLVMSAYEEDARLFGLNPREIDRRISSDMNYEQIRQKIAAYVAECQKARGICMKKPLLPYKKHTSI